MLSDHYIYAAFLDEEALLRYLSFSQDIFVRRCSQVFKSERYVFGWLDLDCSECWHILDHCYEQLDVLVLVGVEVAGDRVFELVVVLKKLSKLFLRYETAGHLCVGEDWSCSAKFGYKTNLSEEVPFFEIGNSFQFNVPLNFFFFVRLLLYFICGHELFHLLPLWLLFFLFKFLYHACPAHLWSRCWFEVICLDSIESYFLPRWNGLVWPLWR